MLVRSVRTAAAGVLHGLGELVSFVVAATSAVVQFLMGRWPNPVLLGKNGRTRSAGSENQDS